jgi:uncharacterized protein HemX
MAEQHQQSAGEQSVDSQTEDVQADMKVNVSESMKPKAFNSFTVVIILAVMVAIGLIVLGLTVYRQTEEDATHNPTAEETQQTEKTSIEDTTKAVETEDIDSEMDQLDSDLNQLNDDDFDEGDLSDDSLGL